MVIHLMALCDLKVQGGVTLTYTVGRSATGVVKVLTREILSLTLELLFFLGFLLGLVLYLWFCTNACAIIIFGCVMFQVEWVATLAPDTFTIAAVATLFTDLEDVSACTARGEM